MNRYGVRPSICPSMGPLLEVCCCGPMRERRAGRRSIAAAAAAGSATLSAYVVAERRHVESGPAVSGVEVLSLSTICVTRWLLAGSVARPAATAPSTPALSCHTEGPKRTLAADVHLCCPAVSHEYPRPRRCLISISSSIGDRQQRRRQISSRSATGKVTVGLESHWPRGADRSAQPLCGLEGNRRS